MIYQGSNAIGDDTYFIRLKDNRGFYLHPDPSLTNSKEIGYTVREGIKGAGGWTKQNAIALIISIGAKNLEIVKVTDIIGKDHSSN